MAASAIYSLEPSTKGSLLFRTTKGDIIIDLFAREAPESCRMFCQLCLNGGFTNAKFNRIVPDTLIQAQASSPSLIITSSLVHEYHSRLQFRGRGVVALVDGTCKAFFITLQPTPWLNRKHTIVGSCKGAGSFVAVKIGESIQENELALDPVTITQVELLEQPFDGEELKPTVASVTVPLKPAQEQGEKKKKVKLSFEEEEEGVLDLSKELPPVALEEEEERASASTRDERLLAILARFKKNAS